jgi:hypothetical protein
MRVKLKVSSTSVGGPWIEMVLAGEAGRSLVAPLDLATTPQASEANDAFHGENSINRPMPQRGFAYQPGATLRVRHEKHECVLKERRIPAGCPSAFHDIWRPYRTRSPAGV